MCAASIVRCPFCAPRKALAELGSGQVLRVLATDPGSGEGLSGFRRSRPAISCSSHDEADKVFTFFMKKR